MPYNPDSTPLTRDSVLTAHTLIKPHIRRTPLRTSTTLSTLATTNLPPSSPRLTLYLKLEPLQKTGSFKLRGATHSILRIPPTTTRVATHSSGNHAAALALAAARVNIPSTIVMPAISTPSKIAATKKYGGKVVLSGPTAPERQKALDEVVERTGAVVVLPYDSNDTIVGQGTVALEVMEQVRELEGEDVDVIVTPVGGGGLLAGCALAALGTGTVVCAAEPKGADDCYRGFYSAGQERVESVEARTVADGLRTPVGVRNWEVVKQHVKAVFRVEESEIFEAMRLVWERCKVVIEPSSAVPVAVVLWNKEWAEWVKREFEGREEVRVGIVITGGNTTLEKVAEMF
ncbi:tryptophan synthase beta subunit-like PLP-dependent enzyme, partial [Ascodesmis nigricans]